MATKKVKISRLLNLLIVLFSISCQSRINSDEVLKDNIARKESEAVDSLKITINNVPGKIFVGINLIDSDLDDINLEFYNAEDKTLSLSKQIQVANSNFTILSFRGFSLINNVHKSYWHLFIVSKPTDKIEFEYKEGDIILTSADDIKSVESIRKVYSEIDLQFTNKQITKQAYVRELEKCHDKYDGLFKKSKDSISIMYNNIEFVNSISKADPKDKRVHDYLAMLENPLYCQALKNIVFNYVNENSELISSINYTDKNISPEFKRLVSIELYSNLVRFKTKKYVGYQKNLDWLKTTDFYSQNKKKIDLALTVEDQSDIAKGLKLFDVYNNMDNKTNLQKIIQENPSEYYLIDFWASWCLPCIRDSKLIHQMALPKNLKILNVSLDKTRDKQKWINRSKELNLEYNFLLVENETNKKFINKINLNQIPRYILIDQYFNIIDVDMLSPSEKSFEEVLYKYTTH